MNFGRSHLIKVILGSDTGLIRLTCETAGPFIIKTLCRINTSSRGCRLSSSSSKCRPSSGNRCSSSSSSRSRAPRSGVS